MQRHQFHRVDRVVGTCDAVDSHDPPAALDAAPLEFRTAGLQFVPPRRLLIVRLLREFGDVAYVWRNLPLSDVHPNAQLAAEAAEAAATQERFWEMHDLLLSNQDALEPDDLVRYAGQIGLDLDRFESDLRTHAGAARVADDADLSGVSGTPTFFVNGRRHYGAYDLATLSNAVKPAGARAVFAR